MKLSRNKIIVSAGLATALAVAVGLNSCMSSVAPITAHGELETAVSIFNGTTPGQAFPDVTDGGQVTVVSSAGTVIATGTLNETSVPGTEAVTDYYTFTVTVPGGLARYGIEVGRNRGTLWDTAAQMRSGPQLCLGDGCGS